MNTIYAHNTSQTWRPHILRLTAAILLLAVTSMVSACRQVEQPPEMLPEATAEANLSATFTAPMPTQTDAAPSTPEATGTPEPPTVLQEYDIVWSSGFETGTLSEWEDRQGEFLRQGSSPYYQIVTDPVRNGSFAAALVIDTSTSSKEQASYLWYYDNPQSAWYSTWFYIPEGTRPLYWWNITQWKSTYNGNSNDSLPMWIISLDPIPGETRYLRMSLVYRADSETEKIPFTNDLLLVPIGEWFHLSTYFVKSSNGDGEISVWLNGEEFVTLTGIHTVLRDNTLYWSVNNYSDEVVPYPAALYVDEVIISQQRIPPEFRLP
ncbi:MAG: heparin lyase I family protein [Anaerolineae bacterium]|nr:heparin lyase I family protein [Anaerolineae bacterium]